MDTPTYTSYKRQTLDAQPANSCATGFSVFPCGRTRLFGDAERSVAPAEARLKGLIGTLPLRHTYSITPMPSRALQDDINQGTKATEEHEITDTCSNPERILWLSRCHVEPTLVVVH
jgi:hypothetical protein